MLLAAFLCVAAYSGVTPDEQAWADLIEECRSAPRKVGFEDVLARARERGLGGAASPTSPQSERCDGSWLVFQDVALDVERGRTWLSDAVSVTW